MGCFGVGDIKGCILEVIELLFIEFGYEVMLLW